MPLKSPKTVVLDSWALLAHIYDERPAFFVVDQLIAQAEHDEVFLHMSWVNLGEAYYSVIRTYGLGEADETLKDILRLPIVLHEATPEHVISAARLKASAALSYADAFAVTLAQRLQADIATGDPEIFALRDVVGVIELIRENRRKNCHP